MKSVLDSCILMVFGRMRCEGVKGKLTDEIHREENLK